MSRDKQAEWAAATALDRALWQIAQEYARAVRRHGPMRSAHEGYAVLLEEMDELWQEVKRQEQNPVLLLEEARHVAAMALRFMVDVCVAELEGQG